MCVKNVCDVWFSGHEPSQLVPKNNNVSRCKLPPHCVGVLVEQDVRSVF